MNSAKGCQNIYLSVNLFVSLSEEIQTTSETLLLLTKKKCSGNVPVGTQWGLPGPVYLPTEATEPLSLVLGLLSFAFLWCHIPVVIATERQTSQVKSVTPTGFENMAVISLCISGQLLKAWL